MPGALVLLVLVVLAGPLLLGRVTEMEVPPPLPLHMNPLASRVPRRARPRNWAVLVEPETIPACRREMRLPQICCLLRAEKLASTISSEKRQNPNNDPSKSKRLGASRSDGSLAGPLPTFLPSMVGQDPLVFSCSLQELDLGWGSPSWSGPACSWGWG